MKHIQWMALVAIVVLALIGCQPSSETTDTTLIYGLWQEQEDYKEYMRFLTADEEKKEDEYCFGREWDEQDRLEKELKYKGNGWFKWKVNGTTLTCINLMDNGSAEIPKTYIIKKLTATEMVLQESDDKDDVETWIKK